MVTIRAKNFQQRQKSLYWEDHWWVTHPLIEVQNNQLIVMQDGLYEFSMELNTSFGNVLEDIYLIVLGYCSTKEHDEKTLKSYIPVALFEQGRRVYLSLSANESILLLRDIKSDYNTSSQQDANEKDSDSEENYSVMRMRRIVWQLISILGKLYVLQYL